MAYQLEQAGEEVSPLALIDTRGVVGQDSIDHTALLQLLVGPLLTPEIMEIITRARGSQQFDLAISAVRTHASHAGPLLPQLTVLRASAIAIEHYHPSDFRGAVQLLQAEEQGDAKDATRPEIYWRRAHRSTLSIHQVPGDHGTMMAEPHVSVVARVLQSALQVSEAAGTAAR
jgi:thioesterase domain-containing protein